MVIDKIVSMLGSCDSATPLFPHTELYNEGWFLRIILDWFSTNNVENHPLSFVQRDGWFSEALLPSAFLPTSRKDPLGESWTHADGVIGHFIVGNAGRADLSLTQDARHFVILEAKMFSKLSKGVIHARYFDQAARTIACIAEVLKRANCHPSEISRLGFYVLAPQVQIDADTFDREMGRESIQAKVERRVSEYKGLRNQWFREWFEPTLEHIEIGCLSWEKVLKDIENYDSNSAREINRFYKRCLEFNAPELKGARTNRLS